MSKSPDKLLKKWAKVTGKCRLCDKPSPEKCSGEIQDHCTWCGEPVAPDPINATTEVYCSDLCKTSVTFNEDDEPKFEVIGK